MNEIMDEGIFVFSMFTGLPLWKAWCPALVPGAHRSIVLLCLLKFFVQ